jgi:hypothetical protein
VSHPWAILRSMAPTRPTVALRPGDHVIVGGSLAPGELVYFERIGPAQVVVRPLPLGGRSAIYGEVYRAEKGEDPYTVRFVLATVA